MSPHESAAFALVAKQLTTLRKRVSAMQDAEPVQGEPGPPGTPGPVGPMPKHEWRGTELRFEKPDGGWGKRVDLRGRPGLSGLFGGDGSPLDPEALPRASALLAGDDLVIVRDGAFMRIEIDAPAAGNVVTVAGVTVTVGGVTVTVS